MVKLARALRLPLNEASALLAAAGYPPLARLQAQAENETDRTLLAFWQEEKTAVPHSPPFQTIPDLPTFVGRQAALHTVTEWLLAGQHHTPIVLAGMAGVGKSALAARLAYRLRPHFPAGVLWARPDATPPMTILHLFAAAYGQDVTPYADLHSRAAAMRQLLAPKRALVVLDDVHSSTQIAPLLPPDGACAVLITTRRRDLAPHARRFPVAPFSAGTSLALFAHILGPDRVAAERPLLMQIAAVVGHLPLALDVVACRLAHEPDLQTAVLLAQLQRQSRLLPNLVHEEKIEEAAIYT